MLVQSDMPSPSRSAPLLTAASLAALVASILCACGSSTTAPAATTPASTPNAADPCAVRAPTGPGGPVTDPSGPYYHQVAVAQTTDGIHLSEARRVLDHASVPDAVRLPDGTVHIYYVNGAEGGVWIARFDGSSAVPVGPLVLNGVARPEGIVDPDATLLPDGRVRLAYLSGFGPPGSGTARAMCLADSTDGLRFTVVGTALALSATDTITDPSLASLDDGSWLMAVSRGTQTLLARAPDGLRFSLFDTLSYGGVPEIAAMGRDGVRLYVCAGGIESHVSTNGGNGWQREATVVAPGTLGSRIVCDPSWVPAAGLFVFKTAS
jgi:hypothetical protein